MFFGHFFIGLMIKKYNFKLSLKILLISVMLLDILALPGIIDPNLILANPVWTHGFFIAMIWSGIFTLISLLFSRNLRTSLIYGFAVFSHWLLDFIAWPMDFGNGLVGLPLFLEGSPQIGLGLYSTLIGSLIGEIIGLLGVVIMIYILRRDRPLKVKNPNVQENNI